MLDRSRGGRGCQTLFCAFAEAIFVATAVANYITMTWIFCFALLVFAIDFDLLFAETASAFGMTGNGVFDAAFAGLVIRMFTFLHKSLLNLRKYSLVFVPFWDVGNRLCLWFYGKKLQVLGRIGRVQTHFLLYLWQRRREHRGVLLQDERLFSHNLSVGFVFLLA
jgi:hypothetical protein